MFPQPGPGGPYAPHPGQRFPGALYPNTGQFPSVPMGVDLQHGQALVPQQRMPMGAAPPQWPGQPYGWPPQLPPQPRRGYFWPVLTTLLVVSMLLALVGASAAVWALNSGGGDSDLVASTWVDMRQDVGGKAVEALLQRHTDAVKNKSVEAWMADVDQSDAAFAQRQRQLIENLIKMPFADISFDRTRLPGRQLAKFLPTQLFDKYHAAVHVEAVTVRHRIEGVDSKTVATPWLPVLAWTGKKWVIAGDASGKDLPLGANGQPWESTGPITVLRDDHIIAVVSANDAERGRSLLQMAVTSLKFVAEVKPSGWDAKVLFTAVQDKRIFDGYFAETPDRIGQVAAIAVPFYGQVGDWASSPAYATTRVVFNPTQLTAQTEELAHDLTHEFTHAAMGPVTSARTPRWVVEGFAEYVAYKHEKVVAAGIRQILGDLAVSTFPTNQEFYAEPRNYLSSWLANRMIAEKYGEDHLIAFYEAFQDLAEVDSVAQKVLGVSQSTLEQQWRDYVAKQRA